MNIQKWNKKTPIFQGELDPIYQGLAHCDVYYIPDKGFAVLNHHPKYHLYARLNAPEIQDVFVSPNARQQGIATQLIHYCEQQCATGIVGISVPVSPNFGAAQRLYYKLGYAPDGNGVTYDRGAITHNSMVKIDDQLCLMMIKDLSFNKP